MVDFGSEQGLSNFETDGVAVPALAGIAGYVEDFKRTKTPLRAKRCRLWMNTDNKILPSTGNRWCRTRLFHELHSFIGKWRSLSSSLS